MINVFMQIKTSCLYLQWKEIYQNKSALKGHTYFMDVKCSKSKLFWMVELHKYHNKAENRRKMSQGITSSSGAQALGKQQQIGNCLSIMRLKDEEI